MKHMPWLTLSLPVLTLLILWDHLPDRMPIHSSGGGPDRYGSRSDFGGVVVGVTGLFALVGYVVVQAAASFSPMSQPELTKAYWSVATGSALMGLVVIFTALLSV